MEVTGEFRINTVKQRFELEIDGSIAYLTYEIVEGVWHLPHTIVPKQLGGKGIGKKLVKLSLDYLRDREINYLPICSFVVGFVAKHKEYAV